MLRDILKEVQINMVPRGLLKEWATHTFPNATDYWAFRKNVSGSVIIFQLLALYFICTVISLSWTSLAVDHPISTVWIC